MLLRFVALRSIVLLAAIGLPLVAATQKSPTQTASASDIRAKISIAHAASGGFMIVATFSTETPNESNVYCLSGYQDLQYVLRDATGNVIPVNPDAWKYPDQLNYYGGGPCESVQIPQHETRVLLKVLYPGLLPGQYTLQITLAPRGRAERAAFRPIQIVVP